MLSKEIKSYINFLLDLEISSLCVEYGYRGDILVRSSTLYPQTCNIAEEYGKGNNLEVVIKPNLNNKTFEIIMVFESDIYKIKTK